MKSRGARGHRRLAGQSTQLAGGTPALPGLKNPPPRVGGYGKLL
jgi:hypothetical protein